VHRRDFLRAAGVLGAGALAIDTTSVFAQAPARARRPGRVDVHHHVFPPKYIAELASRKLATPDMTSWSVAKTLDDMDKAGVTTSILSVTTPAVSFAEPDVARRVARESNEWVAGLRREYPGRFGSFAMLPMQDVDGSLREIEYALDTLKADGIGLLTSYNGKYLGDASFAPVYAELNRRKAVIYVHPLAPNCCGDVVPGIPPGSIEYATDTTRTIAHLVFSGTSQKFPDIRWIFSHSGGTLPFLTQRFIQQQKVQKHPHLPNGPMPEFQKLYYELAQGHTKAQLAGLFEMVKVSQVLYGTDYPYRDGADVNDGIANWKFSAADLRSIENETARKLLPHLKTA
jgi:6-methylsalicylate decarboxylase